jgi:hypothetical protein
VAIVTPGGGSSASSALGLFGGGSTPARATACIGTVLGVAAERKPLEMVIRPYVID